MTQLRHHANGGSTALPWSTLQDHNLSFTARGLLAYCLSLPPGWKFSAERIAASSPHHTKQAVLKALKELEQAGYRRIVTERGERGRITSYAEFAFAPVPEWIKEYQAKQTKSANRKKPGPKNMAASTGASAAQRARQARSSKRETQEFPQVTPKVNSPDSGDTDSGQPARSDVSAGHTESQFTGIRQTELLRENNIEQDTHTPVPSKSDASAMEDRDRVCVEPSSDNIDTKLVESVVARVLSESVPPTPRGRLGNQDKAHLSSIVSACLQRGHSTAAIERRTRGLCNENTLAPMTHLMRALQALHSESPAASAATATTVVSRASQGHSERSLCRRDDCRNGQLVCSLDCTDTCDQLHDPKGANCPTCTGVAPKPRQGGRRIDVKALTEAQRAG